MDKDFRKNQKVLFTIEIENRGQDFIELDLLENGVLLGNSIIFKNGGLSLLGIGSADGLDYFSAKKVISNIKKLNLNGLYIYLKDTGKKDPLPWNASTLNYPVVKIKKAIKPNRFLSK